MTRPTEDTPTPDQSVTDSAKTYSTEQLREAIHMKMLDKSENAKDAGELTVVPLGFAVSIALELARAAQIQLVSELEGELPKMWQDKQIKKFLKDNPQVLPEATEMERYAAGVNRAFGRNEVIENVTALLEHKKQELERGK